MPIFIQNTIREYTKFKIQRFFSEHVRKRKRYKWRENSLVSSRAFPRITWNHQDIFPEILKKSLLNIERFLNILKNPLNPLFCLKNNTDFESLKENIFRLHAAVRVEEDDSGTFTIWKTCCFSSSSDMQYIFTELDCFWHSAASCFKSFKKIARKRKSTELRKKSYEYF